MVLCNNMDQDLAFNVLRTGNNVFLTGNAGTGKTYLLNKYIAYLHSHAIKVAVTASTGIAATHIGGMTIHAFSGIGIRDTLTDYDIDQIEQKKNVYERITNTKVLIIDEISMLSGGFLDMLDRVCKSLRRNDKPFGGLQIILCGDLFQLPPISRDGTATMVFESYSFKQAGFFVCYLSEQFRQTDMQFLDLLNAIRSNTIDQDHVDLLIERMVKNDDEYENQTKLFTHNADVDTINTKKLSMLDTQTREYRMSTKGKDTFVEALKRSCLAYEVLELKIGTEVICIKNNIEGRYVNGTRGTVIGFNDIDNMPIIKTYNDQTLTIYPETWSIEDDGKVKASISQIPLRYGWALTIHKSQGMSLDAAVIDLSKSFTFGMGYVALSRLKTLNGLFLLGLNDYSLRVDPKVLEFDETLQSRSNEISEVFEDFTPEAIEQKAEEFIKACDGVIQEMPVEKHKEKKVKEPSYVTTIELLKQGHSIEHVAQTRELTQGTIISHLEQAIEKNLIEAFSHLHPGEEVVEQVYKVVKSAAGGELTLTQIKTELEDLGYTYSYDIIRIAKMFVR